MELTRLLGYCAGSFAMGFVSGLVPAINTEAYLLMVAALAPRAAVLPAVVFVTAGQMLAKGLLYPAGNGAVSSRFLEAHAARLAGVKHRLARMRAGASAVVFSSAVIGIPPLYLVSIAAGSLHWSFPRFLLVGAGGRLLRFTAIVALPGLLGARR